MIDMTSWKQATDTFTKEWERQAARWWDETLRKPETLQGMGQMLDALCAAKEKSDEAAEQALAALRLPSITDVLRLQERVLDLDARMARIEGLLERLAAQAPAAQAPAAPAPAQAEDGARG